MNQLSEAEHKLRGTRPTRAANPDAQYVAGRPKMPDGLPEIAQAEWKRLTKLLRNRGTLTKADAPALEIYCRMFARWRAYDEEATARPMVETEWIGKDGETHTKTIVNPAAKLAAQLDGQLRQMLREFSATPATREKTKPAKADPNSAAPQPGTVEWYLQQQKQAAAQEEQ